MATLPLNDVVDVIVQISPLSAPRRAFDLGLIIGDTPNISLATRVKTYTNTDAMLEDGFTSTDPEYEAALIYFSQSPTPKKLLIGARSTTSVLTATLVDGGTGYAVGDILTIAGGTGATARVLTVDTGGIVLTIELTAGGYGYTAAVGAATTATPAGGTGATITTTVGTESPVSAVRACRLADNDWYAVYVCDLTVEAEILAVAAYIESTTPTSVFFHTDLFSTGVKDGLSTNIIAQLKALKYERTLIQASSQKYAVVSIMAYALRNNTGLANSTYTLKFKTLPGIAVDTLTATEVVNIEKYNGNVYINRGYYYDMFEQGVMVNGQFFDEVINLDMLANNIQLNVMDRLYKMPKVPQTEAGVTQLVSACNAACDTAVSQGFLAPGKWTGQEILNLKEGDYLTSGYLVQSDAINDQSVADREARKAPPIYVCIKEAGAIHSVTIGVYVVR